MAAADITWTPERRKVSDLKELPNNPRRIKGEAFEKLKQRIAARGFHDVVKVDTEGYILSGNQRRKALIDLGITEVYALTPSRELTKEERDKVILESNRNDGEWDYDILGNEFDLKDLLDVGFEEKDLDIDLSDPKDDEVPEVPEEPVSRLGDLYLLGHHRVLCGDSTKIEDVERLMDGRKADMVFTDPPYGIDYSGGRTQVVATKTYGKLKNDDLTGDDLGNLISQVFAFNKDEADVYICVSPIMQTPFLEFIEGSGKALDAVIVWDKKNAGLGCMKYRRQTEFILFVKGGPFKRGDTSDFDLWSIGRDFAQDYVHGTQKPVAVPTRAIMNSSKRDDIALDLFLGSGSTLIASEKTGRICYGMELDPKYVDVIVKRWEDFTGKKAELIRK